MSSEEAAEPARRHVGWGKVFGRSLITPPGVDEKGGPSKWSMGILNDPKTVEVPGSVLLLAAHRNEPLGLRNVHARTSHSSIPAGFSVETPTTPGGTRTLRQSSTTPTITGPPAPSSTQQVEPEQKTTDDGAIILEPQPDDSGNDPLNWPGWRRDLALLSLGFYCMIGGGITPLIAAGFTDVAETFDVDVESVSLTTGLYMMGLGLGSVIFSPTAILFGKRPVYIGGAILFIGTSVWAGYSPSYQSLLAARVFQGVAISPVECLPSATIAEIFFLHERAYRIGIYTLLLLGGKNLVPLVSAAIIGSFGWRWVFWIVAMVAGLGVILLFLFVPETFWDRTPTRKASKRPSFLRRISSRHEGSRKSSVAVPRNSEKLEDISACHTPTTTRPHKDHHVAWKMEGDEHDQSQCQQTHGGERSTLPKPSTAHHHVGFASPEHKSGENEASASHTSPEDTALEANLTRSEPTIAGRVVPTISIPDETHPLTPRSSEPHPSLPRQSPIYNSYHSAAGSASNIDYFAQGPNLENDSISPAALRQLPKVQAYTHNLRQQPPKSFVQQLRIYHGRLNKDNWFKVMVRPFILLAYPAVLWSSVVYACSIGWLIVISENLAVIYRSPDTYNFTALQTGLVYISPFLGGLLGTGVAGKVSDVIVRAMARRNGGLYEPEYRLVMVIPILFSTVIGLIGFGWSAQVHDNWIVPTLFFGIVSFGCSLGSTTSITFCVDSYRQYAGEALVSLNFAKNVCHGLVFSLFVSQWLEDDGSKMVYIWIGIIQLLVLLTTLPMYIFGKRARMWTARQNLMEKF